MPTAQVAIDDFLAQKRIAVAGGCPLMYGPTSDGGHRFMKAVLGLFGQLPKEA